MLKKLGLIAVVAALGLAACAANVPFSDNLSSKTEADGFAAYAPMEPEIAADDRQALTTASGGAAPGAFPVADIAAQSVDRLVIKNANLTLTVTDPTAANNAITALAEGLGGFVVSSNIYQTSTDAAGNKIMQANVAIRVPAERLNEALAQIKALAVTGEADSENISGEDVTAQYTDLESQLRNLEAAEAQLQTIMEGAKRTEDVLSVYNQLVSVRGEIEQVRGQMKYYSEAAAMSLVNISLLPDALSQPIEVGGWKAEGVAKEAVEALVRAFQGLASAGIWLGIYVLPLGLVFGIPLWLVGRAVVRRLRKPKSAAA